MSEKKHKLPMVNVVSVETDDEISSVTPSSSSEDEKENERYYFELK